MGVLEDPRVEQYGRLIVERALDVQPGWQVLIRATPLARPLLESVVRAIAQRGAYPILRIGHTLWPVDLTWSAEAPEELIGELSEIDRFAVTNMDARLTIDAPENLREGSELPPARRTLRRKAARPFFQRSMNLEIPWNGCQFPTPALAQEAGMTTQQFADFLYGAVLRDWDAEGARMRRYAERFDGAETLRIVGEDTDLTIGFSGRKAIVDEGKHNLPGGEFFFCPVEDTAEGVVSFSEFPTRAEGKVVEGARFVFAKGRIVEASARRGEAELLATIDTDEGARFIGEVGIGCNDGITKHLNNTLFDEKMAGTIHLAIGASYVFAGGKNESAVHWDIVKDLREGGKLYLDGELVQENGAWLI